ncbi:MAG: pyruvate carboxylase subunit B, partial [Gammaproteobacteria bacterium]|nr:pyruvate carboxylase subunit B [Gammaproteobacteria bacterium]
MAGLLKPYDAYDLVAGLKASCDIPVTLHSHATTGLSTASLVKAAEAGIDMVDASISSMSMTYGHSSTETIVAIMEGTGRDTALDLGALGEIAAYFREVRKKYAKFEGALKGTDSRILLAQVPGGMLTNMENQLKEQGAADRFDDVLKEIPAVRKDLGYIPLVTPTSQIVGTQAVLNVLTGERYKNIARETAGILKGEYGATPAPVDQELQARVLDGAEPVTTRPADLIGNELDALTGEFDKLAEEHAIKVADNKIDDVLTYALFPQVGLKFLRNRNNPDAFEPAPGTSAEPAPAAKPVAPAPAAVPASENYLVEVDGKSYQVKVSAGGQLEQVTPAKPQTAAPAVKPASGGTTIAAPLSGMISKINIAEGSSVGEGDVVFILEAMKMETEVRTTVAGTVETIHVKEGDMVQAGDALMVVA